MQTVMLIIQQSTSSKLAKHSFTKAAYLIYVILENTARTTQNLYAGHGLDAPDVGRNDNIAFSLTFVLSFYQIKLCVYCCIEFSGIVALDI